MSFFCELESDLPSEYKKAESSSFSLFERQDIRLVFLLRHSSEIKPRCLALSSLSSFLSSSIAGVFLYSISSRSLSQSSANSRQILIFSLSLSLKSNPVAVDEIIKIIPPAYFIIDFSRVDNFRLIGVVIKQNNV